jgi:1-acyl-sn-glycerol-3-phosphate acyltransferase
MKRELLRIPFFGWALALFDPIAIKRSDGRRAMKQLLEAGAERLARGHSVVIFPEGTRVGPGKRKRFGLGGALLASRAGVPIVLVAHNAGYFWPKRGLIKRPGTIEVVVGPRMESAGLSPTALNAQVEQWVRTTQESLPAPAPVQRHPRPRSDAASQGS